MLKMFTTQLSGLLSRIHEQNEFAIEDSARLLAQSLVGEGSLYLYGNHEMEAISAEAFAGAEPFKEMRKWDGVQDLTISDRVIIFSRFSHEQMAVQAGKLLLEKGIPFVAVSSHIENGEENLTQLADVHIDLLLKKPLLPDDEGNRYGYPASIAALYVYHAVTFTIREILDDY